MSEIFVLPNSTPSGRNSGGKTFARVLTSAEAFEALEQKEKQKKAEQEEKERRKKEREEKKMKRQEEEEKKKKEREEKKLERERVKLQKEQEREAKKTKQMEARAAKQRDKENQGSSSSCGPKKYPTRKMAKNNVAAKVSDDICAVCAGAYQDDIDEAGDITADWIQCSDSACAVWSHMDCLEKHATGYVCALCFTIFK